MTKLWRRPFDADMTVVPPAKVKLDTDKCKGCGYCSEFCPRDVLLMTSEINARGYTPAAVAAEHMCLACGLCEIICPEFAIQVISTKGEN